jgi:broad specificity phosphatase PhoE
VGERLKSWHFDLGIVSDLKRAVATAGAIVDQSSSLQNVLKWETVRERNFGDFEGRPSNDLRLVEETIPESEKSTWGPPNGETGVQFRKRVETFLQHLCSEVKQNCKVCPTVLLVTHSGFIRQLNLIFVDSCCCSMPEGNAEFSTYLGSRLGWSPNTGVSSCTVHKASDGVLSVECEISGCGKHLLVDEDNGDHSPL